MAKDLIDARTAPSHPSIVNLQFPNWHGCCDDWPTAAWRAFRFAGSQVSLGGQGGSFRETGRWRMRLSWTLAANGMERKLDVVRNQNPNVNTAGLQVDSSRCLRECLTSARTKQLVGARPPRQLRQEFAASAILARSRRQTKNPIDVAIDGIPPFCVVPETAASALTPDAACS